MLSVRYDPNTKTPRRLGYARVSTFGQTLDAQLEQLRGDECTKIYRDAVVIAFRQRLNHHTPPTDDTLGGEPYNKLIGSGSSGLGLGRLPGLD